VSESNKETPLSDKLKNLLKFESFRNIPSFIEFLEKGLERELFHDPEKEKKPIPVEDLPVDLALRQSSPLRKLYEHIFPITHVFKTSFRYKGEFLENFMPITNGDYIGRGSYKFVYKLPWNQVVKVGKSKWLSDPLFGSLYKEVSKNLEKYLKPEELQLKEFLQKKTYFESSRELIDFKFKRMGLERLHYWKLKSLIPDLVMPTRFFMGIRFRSRPFLPPLVTMTPCDNQKLLAGKHLKEFIRVNEKVKKNLIEDTFFPKWKLNFDTHRFGIVTKPKLKKIAFDFHRVIEATRHLVEEEKLILDLHSENIIITIPDFELKIFDYHVFDEHLYEPSLENPSPEIDHIKLIEEFISSFEL